MQAEAKYLETFKISMYKYKQSGSETTETWEGEMWGEYV